MPPTEYLSAHIVVSKEAKVIAHPPGEKMQTLPVPAEAMDIYVWREKGDSPVIVTNTTKPGELGSRGNTADFSFSLASDLFEIMTPEPAIVVTGRGQMTIDTSGIKKVAPFSGPLNGKLAYMFVNLPDKKGRLLRQGNPKFSCALGRESPDASLRRYLLSWSKKLSKKDVESFCVENSETPQKISKDQLKRFADDDGIVILEYAEDDC